MKKTQINIYTDWTGSSLELLLCDDRTILLCASDEQGFTGVHLTEKDWQTTKEVIDKLFKMTHMTTEEVEAM